MAVNIVNPNADVLRRFAALSANCSAGRGLQEVLKSNLGPRGTLKMLVGGAGQIKITKDGNVLLQEMQIQHPTASMIARAATAMDEMTGDGTTSNVLFIGEMLRIGERYIHEGIHPHILCEGIDIARKELINWLDVPSSRIHSTSESEQMTMVTDSNNTWSNKTCPIKICVKDRLKDRELLKSVARTSLRTKLHPKIADHLTQAVVEAVLTVQDNSPFHDDSLNYQMSDNTTTGTSIDLFRVELVHMKHRIPLESRLVNGIVMDHGCRHPDMPHLLKNCFILTLNVSLEYEKSEVNSGFFYSNAEQREKLVLAERAFTDEKCRKIINLKREACSGDEKKSYGFVILNQKGIDPPSLDMFAKEGIMALRRVKRRNMERLTLCCGGEAVNCVDELTVSDLGFAETVEQVDMGEEKYTFVEGVKNPHSCTILVKAPNDHTIAQMKEAIRDGLRAVKNVLEDGYVVPGAGAFEIAAYHHLQNIKKIVRGKKKYGVDIVAEGLLVIPKTLAENSGLDPQDTLLNLIEKYQENCLDTSSTDTIAVGIDVNTGQLISPVAEGIYDNYRVKRQMLSIAPTLTENLLQVDEILRAGKSMNKG